MSLFGNKKGACSCANHCNANIAPQMETKTLDGADIKILGSGCAKCNTLQVNTHKALQELGIDTSIDHVHDFLEIAKYGVMTTPALVYNGKVLSYGKVLKTDEIISLIQQAQQD